MDFKILEMALKRIPFEKTLHHVETGDQAMEFLNREGDYADAPQPDLVLLDVNLPGINGHEVLEHIKSDPVLRSIPVLMLTTSSLREDVEKAYKGMANGYLTKGYGSEVVETLRTLTQFWFSLVRLPSGETRRPKHIFKENCAPINSHVRILYIDDAPLEGMIIKEAAEELDFQYPVQLAGSADEGMACLLGHPESSKPDLILLDIHLPGMDGIEFLEKLRGDPENQMIHVVALSGSEDDQDILEAYRNYVNAFINKPIDYAGVLEVLATIGQWFSVVKFSGKDPSLF